MNLVNIAPYSKAIAAALAGALVAFLIKKDIVITPELNDAVEVLLSALITGVVVYFAPKNKA